MAISLEKMRWQLYLKKQRMLLNYGIKMGLVRKYDDDLLERLRHVYYGGLPATILLLHRGLSNGYCYDRGTLVTLGFGEDDFCVVDADVDSLRLNPVYIEQCRNGELGEEYGDHCFAERTDKDGIVWVYDTSMGLAIEKSLYYKMERPKVRVVRDRKSTLSFLYEDFLRDSDIRRDKYVLPLTLPFIESNMVPTQPLYLEQLKREIEMLKQEVDYEGICREIDDERKAKGII